jgi:stage V sporulation protein AC
MSDTKNNNGNKFVNDNYLEYIKTQAPKTKHFSKCIQAFAVGGFICAIGQFFRYMLEFAGLKGDELAGSVSIILIFLGCLLTGLGVYDKIANVAGAGSIVPITGFANSVCSPAIEFKTEGWIYGMAAKMFVVAGPIIVFGVFFSVLVGLAYMFI